ncbi:MAG: hypothetical protein JXB13_08220 [Phycisphaerae bacterium]|nr:hypothetical protein [Phycisphaerae bacterium]
MDKKVTQTFQRERECKGSVRYVPDPGAVAAGTELTSVVYVQRSVLAKLGDPQSLKLTLEA